MDPDKRSSFSVMGAEVPLGCGILITGMPGVGKTSIARSVFREAASSARKGVIVALEPGRREGHESQFAKDCKIVYLDAYSWKTGASNEKYSVKNLSNLNDLSIKMMEAADEVGEDFFYSFNSISDLSIYCKEEEMLRFVDVVMAYYRARRGTGLWVVEEGIHSDSFNNMLKHLADAVLEVKLNGQGDTADRFCRWSILRGPLGPAKWLKFSISSGGGVISDENDPSNHKTMRTTARI